MRAGALPALQELYLHHNRIGDDGMRALASAISSGAMSGCSLVDLDNNLATESGKRMVREAAKGIGTLQVAVSGSQSAESGLGALVDQLE